MDRTTTRSFWDFFGKYQLFYFHRPYKSNGSWILNLNFWSMLFLFCKRKHWCRLPVPFLFQRGTLVLFLFCNRERWCRFPVVILSITGKGTLCHVEFSHRTIEMILLSKNQPNGSRGIGVRLVANEISRGIVIKRTGGTHALGGRGAILDFWFFSSLLYGMPAPSSDIQHPEAWPANSTQTFKRKLKIS